MNLQPYSIKTTRNAFSLIELLIVIVIIAILAAIAYPSYTQYLIKTKRSEGHIALIELSQKMERYYGEQHSYQGATFTTIGAHDYSGESLSTSHYQLAIVEANGNQYLLTASARGTQATQDEQCAVLAINQFGQRGIMSNGHFEVNAECW